MKEKDTIEKINDEIAARRYAIKRHAVRCFLYTVSAVFAALNSLPSLNAAGVSAGIMAFYISILALHEVCSRKKEMNDLLKKRDELMKEDNSK